MPAEVADKFWRQDQEILREQTQEGASSSQH